METVSFEPVKVEAMIHSLREKREVFIVLYDDPMMDWSAGSLRSQRMAIWIPVTMP